jgi:hypothetical protein
MMDFVEDGKAEASKRCDRKDARTDCLNHGNGDVKVGSYIATIALDATDANSRHQGLQFRFPLFGEELLVDEDEKAATDARGRRDARKGLSVSAGKADDSIILGLGVGLEGFGLMGSQRSAKGEGRRQQGSDGSAVVARISVFLRRPRGR